MIVIQSIIELFHVVIGRQSSLNTLNTCFTTTATATTATRTVASGGSWTFIAALAITAWGTFGAGTRTARLAPT